MYVYKYIEAVAVTSHANETVHALYVLFVYDKALNDPFAGVFRHTCIVLTLGTFLR